MLPAMKHLRPAYRRKRNRPFGYWYMIGWSGLGYGWGAYQVAVERRPDFWLLVIVAAFSMVMIDTLSRYPE